MPLPSLDKTQLSHVRKYPLEVIAIVFAAAIIYLFIEMRSIDKKMVDYMAVDRVEMIKVIESNTQALKAVTK